MKSNVSGRVVPQPCSSGCRPQNIFYNHPGVHHHSQQQQQLHHQHQHQSLAYHQHHQQVQQQNYAMLQCFSQHTSNGWAGIPLISTAASSNRRQRKPASSTHRSPPALSCNSLHIYNSGRDQHPNEYNINPMTRLAMHAQGAPLLLTGSYNRNRMNGGSFRQMKAVNSNQNEGFTCKPGGGQLSLHLKAKENNNGGSGGAVSSAHSEAAAACLPRIIKPRKRRKKDRKPLAPSGNFMKLDNEPETVVVPKNNGPTSFFDQQHHHPQMPGFEYETQCNLKSDESAIDVQQDQVTGSVCFCRQCDPLSRIWAFPLRRSHSDNSSDTTKFERTNKNVGVIGSNRSSHVNLIKNTHTGSLSDSSDSGYGDILSGIHIGDDSFNNNYLQLQKLPTDLLLSPTAESLLTESINEISRKLMETCDIKGNGGGGGGVSSSSSSSSSDSCSVFSDSGLSSATSSNHPSADELIFNFENLSINSADHSNLLFSNNDSIFDCFSADVNNNNIAMADDVGGGSLRIDPTLFNCLDMLWGTQPSSHPPDISKSATKSPESPSSSSSTVAAAAASSSFYRPTVASM